VTVISIDYVGDNSNAPTPEPALGVSIQAKPDGWLEVSIKPLP